MDYFCSKSPKSSNAGDSATKPPFRFNYKKMCKDPTPIENFWLMFENFGAKRSLHFIFSAPSLFKNRSRATNYRRYKQIQQFSKNLEYCSQNNVLHFKCYNCQTKIFSLSYLLILFKVQLSSEYVLKQNLNSNMSKITSSSLKIVKIAQR